MLDFSAADWTIARVSVHTEFATAYEISERTTLLAFSPRRTIQRRVSRHSKRTEEVRVPLFPGYICVGWPRNEARDWGFLRTIAPNVRGALRLAASQDAEPVDALLAPSVVELLARPEKEAVVKRTQPFNPGDMVQFVTGPFRGLDFQVAGTEGQEVELYLSLFGSERNVTANVADLVEAR